MQRLDLVYYVQVLEGIVILLEEFDKFTLNEREI
jgi:hypothetical protein